MEFITSNISKTTGIIISSSSTSSSSGGGSYSAPTFLSLSTTSTKINDGVAMMNTSDGGVYGGVTGTSANYLISSSTGSTDNGWIFKQINTVSGTSENVAAIDATGAMSLNSSLTLNNLNNNKQVTMSVDDNGYLTVSNYLFGGTW